MKTLQMVFTAGDHSALLNVANPKDDLTLATVREVGDQLAADGVFANKYGVYTHFERAQVVERTVTELA